MSLKRRLDHERLPIPYEDILTLAPRIDVCSVRGNAQYRRPVVLEHMPQNRRCTFWFLQMATIVVDTMRKLCH